MKKYFIIAVNYLIIILFPIAVLFFIPWMWFEIFKDYMLNKTFYIKFFKLGEKFVWQD